MLWYIKNKQDNYLGLDEWWIMMTYIQRTIAINMFEQIDIPVANY